MKLILSSDQEKTIELSAELIPLAKAERIQISLRRFFLLVILAGGALFIPVLHFLLVPLFLLLAVIFGIKAYSTRYRFKLIGQSQCLQCQRPIKSEILLDQNLRVKCDHCFARYLLEF